MFELDEYREIKKALEDRKKIIEALPAAPETHQPANEKEEILRKKIKSAWDLYEWCKPQRKKNHSENIYPQNPHI